MIKLKLLGRLVLCFCFLLVIVGFARGLETNGVVTENDAIIGIAESQDIMNEMIKLNFSVSYINDSLGEAKRIFEQVRYADILNGKINSTEKEREEARLSLKLVDVKKISYAGVLVYTKDIVAKRDQAYMVYDKINAEERNLEGISESAKEKFNEAKKAFYEERYNDAEELFNEYRQQTERDRASAYSLTAVSSGAKNFFQRYWVSLLLSLIILLAVLYLVRKRIMRVILRKKIRNMKTESGVLKELIKKTQEERFRNNKISALVYNIRMEKYKERTEEIKKDMPVMENRLAKMRKKN